MKKELSSAEKDALRLQLAQRFTINSWVCDWGIYDNVSKQFIGSPLGSYRLAQTVLSWFIVATLYKELP